MHDAMNCARILSGCLLLLHIAAVASAGTIQNRDQVPYTLILRPRNGDALTLLVGPGQQVSFQGAGMMEIDGHNAFSTYLQGHEYIIDDAMFITTKGGERPAPAVPLAEESRPVTFEYLGCYKDKPPRDLDHVFQAPGPMTVKKCTDYCAAKKYDFAALQTGGQCFCGNGFGRYGRTDDEKCSMPCTGDRKQHCGGAWANAVYRLTR